MSAFGRHIATGGGCFSWRSALRSSSRPTRPSQFALFWCIDGHLKEVSKTDASGCRAERPSCAHSPRRRQPRKNPPVRRLTVTYQPFFTAAIWLLPVVRSPAWPAHCVVIPPLRSSPTTWFAPSRALRCASLARNAYSIGFLLLFVRCRRSTY